MKGVWMMVMVSFLHAQEAAYQSGLSMAPSLDVRGVDIGQVPGRESSHKVDVARYVADHGWQASADKVMRFQTDSAGGRFFVDSATDPIFVNAERAVDNPHQTMGHMVLKDVPEAGRDELVTCEQGGSEYLQSCEKHLEIDLEVKPETYRTEHYCPGHVEERESRDCFGRQGLSYRPWGSHHYFSVQPRLIEIHDRGDGGGGSSTSYCHPGCQSRVVVDQPKSVRVTREEWIDGCRSLEDLADRGLCQCVSSEIGPKETRNISGEPIERGSWFEKYTYTCLKASANNCGALAAKGCVPVGSRCKESIAGVCVLYEQTYRCSKGKKKGVSYRARGKHTPFCLTGDCMNDQYDDNDELLEVMSQLAVLQQVQKDMRSGLTIFGGQIRGCRKHAIGFSDCCTTGGNGSPERGWGQSMGLMGCNVEEKELAEWRPQGRCVLVGTYCAEREKITKICLRKKTSFCCFGNKLSRLIQEQGRVQLGMGWGTPKEPDCQGLTPEELSRLDFSNMDLSELFQDVARNFHPPSRDHMAQGAELDRIRANMAIMTQNLKKSKEPA